MDSSSPEQNTSSLTITSTSNPDAPPVHPPEPSQSQRPALVKQRNSLKKTQLERPLADIVSEEFPPFDAEALIVRPFEDEAARDVKFEKELSGMLIDVILDTHAWASARPKHEAAVESQTLEEQISHIISIERAQGMSSPAPSSSSSFFRFRIVEQTRERLGDFVQRMKKALAALTGSPF